MQIYFIWMLYLKVIHPSLWFMIFLQMARNELFSLLSVSTSTGDVFLTNVWQYRCEITVENNALSFVFTSRSLHYMYAYLSITHKHTLSPVLRNTLGKRKFLTILLKHRRLCMNTKIKLWLYNIKVRIKS